MPGFSKCKGGEGWLGTQAHHSQHVILDPLEGPHDGEHDGVEGADEGRYHEADKGSLLRDQQHEAREHELARKLDRLPPVPGRFVLPVEEGGGPGQRSRRLGLQRLVASGEERREEDQRAGGPEDDETDGEGGDGSVIVGAALDARVLPHVGDLL